ncbi:NAD-dependent epimerase/dehydratase family protein [Salisediminibacterium halotolerans]|uniref:polysaccharide biosynthesis C-terminal domain-containing protein n=1 Tax=Salisediminibacterium halotolerans TaxID=517425 RepID=UPI000EAD595D|nr:NAD-dependent epimerase/dehydratase family protein [Salisediminibacterium halotolerans]RLJ75701.1 UDP-2-acetamido-2,6-beta-L-arabino-hexul-4-ose reductase [Actinophytocola xinjiangensis]RPE89555.1 UDP-2-acetamido-2,6-beta-L-arabino-hexul-4-ose reductase [Salisediminibacterium halotolerans]TWG36314.1 UDP-2-acetamido-2,6-beta-L-arabino-hexul-4-ose reductase [Salisediminibacterium halotolerans]GEL07238.1 capsular polysaccharide biosynthesis protein Cap8F [Salisediminibacterium halotolerans]
MNIVVTGARGFIGKNLIAELQNRGYENILQVTRETTTSEFETYLSQADFVFHLAGVNRPKDDIEFDRGNTDLTKYIVSGLIKRNNHAPLLFTSSTQAENDSRYGKTKLEAESAVQEREHHYILRLPNVFGKWSLPNYNTVVATFCHNVARDIDIQVNDPDKQLELVYIDDVVDRFIELMERPKSAGFYKVPVTYNITLGELAAAIQTFRDSRRDLFIPDMQNELTKKLYSTYLSFLPAEAFSYPLKMNVDARGSFTEFLKSDDRGQVSVNVSKPGITKGNHWHHTKNEKFLVVSGQGVIRFRPVNSEEIIEYYVDGSDLNVVDIPPGYTHNIENLGQTDMVTVMWANETFDPNDPDTYFLGV